MESASDLQASGAATATNVAWQVSMYESFNYNSIVASGEVAAVPAKAGSLRASAQVSGLAPGTRYYYRFTLLPNGPHSDTGSFVTSTPDTQKGTPRGLAGSVCGFDPPSALRHNIAPAGRLSRH